MNLFLNYFLSRFLDKYYYRLVRYGVRYESKLLKIAIVAFRAIESSKKRETILGVPTYERYWKKSCVFKDRFKQGVFWHKYYGASKDMTPPVADAVGVIYHDKGRKNFSTNPSKILKKALVFLTDWMGVEHSNDSREVFPVGLIGFNSTYHVKVASNLMVLRYAIRKSVLRALARKPFPVAPRVFKRAKFVFSNMGQTLFSSFAQEPSRRNLLFSFLIMSTKIKNTFLKSYSACFNSRIKKCFAYLKRERKSRLKPSVALKKKNMKIKNKYFLFKNRRKIWKKWTKNVLLKSRSFFRKGQYCLTNFFKKLSLKAKPFRHSLVYKQLRASRNRFVGSLGDFDGELGGKRLKASFENLNFFELFFKQLIRLASLFGETRLEKNKFLIGLIFKKYFRTQLYNWKAGRRLPSFGISKSPALNLKKKLFLILNDGVRRFKGFKGLKVRCLRLKKKIIKLKKTNFFLHFFFSSCAVFKSYRLKFKFDSLKHLYRKKKLIFFFETKLSKFLKRRVAIKFFNPLDFGSMDDVWVKSVRDSLNMVSDMYIRDKRSIKSIFVLALHTVLAFKYNSPAVLGAYIANQLEWRRRKRIHRNFIHTLINFFKTFRPKTVYVDGLAGFSVGFYGKVWGKLRAGKYIIRSGDTSKTFPLRRASLRVDSSFTWAESQFGTFGIRIWIARH